jgi:FkbM family methyltransferase
MIVARKVMSAARLAKEAIFDRYAIPKVCNERISKAFIQRFLPAKPVIIDCGAHDGADTINMARRWPGARLHAFEPVPEVYARLRANTRAYPNIECYPLAISDRTGVDEMHISTGASDASSSLLTPGTHLEDHPAVLFESKRQVETTTFSDWARDHGVSRVDLFWLDMQGSEPDALRASKDLLRTATAVYTEVSVKEVYHGISLYPEFRSWMAGQGFRVALEAVPDGWDAGNVLFVKDPRL